VDLRPRYQPYGGGHYEQQQRFTGKSRPVEDEPYHREEDSEEILFRDHMNTGINFDKYDAIPVETFGTNIPSHVDSFSQAHLPPSLFNNIEKAGYQKPTPVQKYSLPIVGTAQRDLMACAQTGSGKTGGFLFPIISRLLIDEKPEPPNRSFDVAYPSALILAPTRELATQIYDEARKFIYRTGLRAVVVYGGADIRWQLRQIQNGCDILVATPGRLVDLYDRGNISLSCIRFLTLDEADRMLDMGFEQQIRYVVEKTGMPESSKRITLMFSATFPKAIQKLAADFLRKDYIFLTVGRVGSTTENITQQFEFCEDDQKKDLLIKYLMEMGSEHLTLIFTKTKKDADELEMYLMNKGFKATSIHGDRSQRQREFALRNFKSGVSPILVATDVAARGLDIPDVAQVINYDLPENIDDYVHRIGRTGRAGNKGRAIAFFTYKNRNIAQELIQLLKDANQEVPTRLLDAADQQQRRQDFRFRGYSGGRGNYRGGGYGGRGGHPFGRGGGGPNRFGSNYGGPPRDPIGGSGGDGGRGGYYRGGAPGGYSSYSGSSITGGANSYGGSSTTMNMGQAYDRSY